MVIACLAFAYSGFAILGATTRKQYAKNTPAVFDRWCTQPAILPLRITGLVLIAVALVYCMVIWGVTIGIAAGWLILASAAYLVVLTITYTPKKLLYNALACLVGAIMASWFMQH